MRWPIWQPDEIDTALIRTVVNILCGFAIVALALIFHKQLALFLLCTVPFGLIVLTYGAAGMGDAVGDDIDGNL